MCPFGGGNPFDGLWTEEAPPTRETFFPSEPDTLDHITSISSLSKVLNCLEKESHGAVELQRKAYDLFQEDEVYFKCIDRCLINLDLQSCSLGGRSGWLTFCASACHAGSPGLIPVYGQTYDKCGKIGSFL
jgi:hypothetical protein